MTVDRPQAAEEDEAADGGQREAEEEGGEVDEPHGVDGIERVFAVRRQPIEMLGTVMHGVESPEEADAVLEPVAPVDAEIAEPRSTLEELQPVRLPRPIRGTRRR